MTAIGLLAWAAFATTVQVLVYARGLNAWDELEAEAPDQAVEEPEPAAPAHRGRFDPRAVSLAAALAFVAPAGQHRVGRC